MTIRSTPSGSTALAASSARSGPRWSTSLSSAAPATVRPRLGAALDPDLQRAGDDRLGRDRHSDRRYDRQGADRTAGLGRDGSRRPRHLRTRGARLQLIHRFGGGASLSPLGAPAYTCSSCEHRLAKGRNLTIGFRPLFCFDARRRCEARPSLPPLEGEAPLCRWSGRAPAARSPARSRPLPARGGADPQAI